MAFALTIGLAIGCSTAPGPVTGAQGPGGADQQGPGGTHTQGPGGVVEFPKPLMDVLASEVVGKIKGQPDLAIKYSLFSNALANLDFSKAGNTNVHLLDSPKNFEQTKTSQPGYFKDKFENKKVTVHDAKKARYDYGVSGATWVDFSAIQLGGGPFHDGFLQEETMVMEMPELANVVAKGGNFTRGQGCDVKAKKDGPLQCSPTPLFIGPVHRTIEINSDLAKKWTTLPPREVFSYIKPLDKNLELNALSMAVAELPENSGLEVQAGLDTVNDLFNTFVAAFTVAKANGVDTVNTGGIGTGAFHNSTKVVYALQKLAAMQVGVNLYYYGLKPADPPKFPKTEQEQWDPIVDDIVDTYNKSGTHTVKHLLELASDKLKKP